MEGIKEMIEVAVSDYAKGGIFAKTPAEIEDKRKEFVVKEGRKYIKVMDNNGGSAWAFIVKTDDDPKFKRGDILMAAGWATPARNAARGNVLERNFSWIRWTGPDYLK
jgi:hypothetical protein